MTRVLASAVLSVLYKTRESAVSLNQFLFLPISCADCPSHSRHPIGDGRQEEQDCHHRDDNVLLQAPGVITSAVFATTNVRHLSST